MIRPRVDTTGFYTTHLRKPRGFGMWAFRLCRFDGSEVLEIVSGNYGQAKAEAIARARQIGNIKSIKVDG